MNFQIFPLKFWMLSLAHRLSSLPTQHCIVFASKSYFLASSPQPHVYGHKPNQPIAHFHSWSSHTATPSPAMISRAFHFAACKLRTSPASYHGYVSKAQRPKLTHWRQWALKCFDPWGICLASTCRSGHTSCCSQPWLAGSPVRVSRRACSCGLGTPHTAASRSRTSAAALSSGAGLRFG